MLKEELVDSLNVAATLKEEVRDSRTLVERILLAYINDEDVTAAFDSGKWHL